MHEAVCERKAVCFLHHEIEILSYQGLTPADESMIHRFLSSHIIVGLEKDVRERTIALRKKYRLKLPDSMIAATAWNMRLALLTADRAFLRIEEIETVLLDPAAHMECEKKHGQTQDAHP